MYFPPQLISTHTDTLCEPLRDPHLSPAQERLVVGPSFPRQESRPGSAEQLAPAQSTRTLLPHICQCWPQSLIGYHLFYKGKRHNCSNTRSWGFTEQHIHRCYLAEHLERNTDNCAKVKVSLHLPGMKTESCKVEPFRSYPNKTSKGS